MRRLMIGSLLLFLSVGCNSQPIAPDPPAPFGGPVPAAAIGTGSLAVSSLSCFDGVSPATNLNLLVTSIGTGFLLDNVTFQLINGNTVGGRTVTFPSADLTRQFGNTFVPVGTTRPFGFVFGFGCVPTQVVNVVNVINISAVVVDGSGVSHVLNTTATMH